MNNHRTMIAAFLVAATLLPSCRNDRNSDALYQKKDISIPTVDISDEVERQSVIAQGTDFLRQAHPSTVLTADGKTIFVTWNIGHGGECGPTRKSTDGGVTWTDVETPEQWHMYRNCPPFYRNPDPTTGKERIFTYAQRNRKLFYACSEDEGESWSEFMPCKVMNSSDTLLADIMPFTGMVPIKGGKALVAVTNIRSPYSNFSKNIVGQSYSFDGGFSWTQWRAVLDLDEPAQPCEPFIIPSPDGKQLLMIVRENNHLNNSWIMTSDNEGQTWSEPFRAPASVTFDRHEARYAPDGRLVIVGRDRSHASPSLNHFVAWVGTYDDLVSRREGQYRIKLLHSYYGSVEYPGIEILPDGTFVCTTSVEYRPGENYSVVCTRFKISETDKLIGKKEVVHKQIISIPTISISDDSSRQCTLFQGSKWNVPKSISMYASGEGDEVSARVLISRMEPVSCRTEANAAEWCMKENPAGWNGFDGYVSTFRVSNPDGSVSCLAFTASDGIVHRAVSTDGGVNWSGFLPVSTTEGKQLEAPMGAFSSIISLNGGKRLLGVSQIQNPSKNPRLNNANKSYLYSKVLVQSTSEDGGMTWTPWSVIMDPGDPYNPSNPQMVISPDGKQILLLCADDYHEANSWIMTSDDGGENWSEARQALPDYSFDNTRMRYAPDGRLVIAGRDERMASESIKQYVAWVGTYDDITGGKAGQYRVEMLGTRHNTIECGGLEILPDGTCIATACTQDSEGDLSTRAVSTRFNLSETDGMLQQSRH